MLKSALTKAEDHQTLLGTICGPLEATGPPEEVCGSQDRARTPVENLFLEQPQGQPQGEEKKEQESMACLAVGVEGSPLPPK